MSRWNQLFSRMTEVEAERLEAERREREALAARADFDAWAVRALSDVWKSITGVVEVRVRELVQATGRRVALSPRVQGIEGPRGLPALRILELRIDSSVAYIYSHHVSGSPPHFHLAHWPAPSKGRRHHRMMSFPVCIIERAGVEGWALRRSVGPSRDPLQVDDVVFRAFELLIGGVERPERQRLAPVPGDTLPLGSPE